MCARIDTNTSSVVNLVLNPERCKLFLPATIPRLHLGFIVAHRGYIPACIAARLRLYLGHVRYTGYNGSHVWSAIYQEKRQTVISIVSHASSFD